MIRNSCLYECDVSHQRLIPRKHGFVYRIFMFYLDLDEMDVLSKELRLVSRNRVNLFSIRDDDHLPLGAPTLRENVTSYLVQNGIREPTGRIFLLTYLRTCGYIFNPVSFYFCFDKSGAPQCAIPEVGNTFGEMKPFMLNRECLIEENLFYRIVPKHFYVSPFFNLDVNFEFKLRIPGDRLEIHINDVGADGERMLLAALTGRRRPLTDGQLLWFSLKYPLITLKVISLIHWNALMLYLKKIPHHSKSVNPALQRDVLKPHSSISERANRS